MNEYNSISHSRMHGRTWKHNSPMHKSIRLNKHVIKRDFSFVLFHVHVPNEPIMNDIQIRLDVELKVYWFLSINFYLFTFGRFKKWNMERILDLYYLLCSR